ncbi:MAG: anhydro-N-acetylmuramic acid kinase [Phycisphaeraceae bacterium]|nr:anhydro-N-acetylmuramic acid kinase [Phycisphaeraceae bacterium]
MTGTSLDGLDIAVVQVQGRGLDVVITLVESKSFILETQAQSLRKLADDKPIRPSDLLRIKREFGAFHAQALASLEHASKLDFVVAHGQTIGHFPSENLSWQLFDPWPIVHRLSVPVCFDLRQADLMAGGNGAPITPLADWMLYRHRTQSRTVVNLGGICNVTWLAPDAGETQKNLNAIWGIDIGPCNLLLDGLVQKLYPDRTFDTDGKIAASGKTTFNLLDKIYQAPFFQRPKPRTTGREDFDEQWVLQLLASVKGKPQDIIHSAVDAVAQLIAKVLNTQPQSQVILAGGSTQNPLLVAYLRKYVTPPVLLSDTLGIPTAMREAMAMAVLGGLCQDGIPITLPQVTGRGATAIAGTWAGLSK